MAEKQPLEAQRITSDNLCKELAERYPEQFARWLFDTPASKVKVLKTELNREPIRADSVILSGSTNEIFHIEFQTTTQSKVPLPMRMLDYYVGLKRGNLNKRIRQVLIVLKETPEEIMNTYQDEQIYFRYAVVKMWEQEAQALMRYEGLLPLATLCHAASGEGLLTEIAAKIKRLKTKEQKRETLTFSQVLAGLRYNKSLVYQILKESDMLEESSVYQDILQKGVRKGFQQGESTMVIHQLTRKVGRLSPKVRQQIESLSSKQLELLGEELLDFRSKDDLTAWLTKSRS